MRFWVNHDLDHLIWSWHNMIHLFGSMLAAAVLTFKIIIYLSTLWAPGMAILFGTLIGSLCAWVIGILWDVGDGFKPCWKKGLGKPWIIQQLFYSDGFSLQDVFVWDLGGSLTGAGLGVAIYYLITFII